MGRIVIVCPQEGMGYHSCRVCHTPITHLSLEKTFPGLVRAHGIFYLYTLESRYQLKLYVFAYRCLHGLASSLLSDMFVLRAEGSRTAVSTRGQSYSALVLPCARTRYGFTSISFLAADRWNSLPLECRQACSIPEFVSHVKLYLGFPGKKA